MEIAFYSAWTERRWPASNFSSLPTPTLWSYVQIDSIAFPTAALQDPKKHFSCIFETENTLRVHFESFKSSSGECVGRGENKSSKHISLFLASLWKLCWTSNEYIYLEFFVPPTVSHLISSQFHFILFYFFCLAFDEKLLLIFLSALFHAIHASCCWPTAELSFFLYHHLPNPLNELEQGLLCSRARLPSKVKHRKKIPSNWHRKIKEIVREARIEIEKFQIPSSFRFPEPDCSTLLARALTIPRLCLQPSPFFHSS